MGRTTLGIEYRGRRLDGSVKDFHRAVDLLEADTVPEAYYLRVRQGRAVERER